MRFVAILLLLLLTCGVSAQDLQSVQLSVGFSDVPLRDAISHLEKKFDLNFSFPNAEIEACTVNCQFDEAGWAEIEQCLFGANNLQAAVLGEGYISLKPVPASTERSWELDFVVQSTDGLALPFVPLQFPGKAATTDESGRFRGVITAAPEDLVYLAYLGYESEEVRLKDFVSGNSRRISLRLSAIELSSVLVSEYLSDGISAPEDGAFIRVDPSRAPAVPGFTGPEVFRTLSLLPGISNTEETAGGLSIRGGSPDQNLVLWDGIPVYTGGHFFSMISPFSSELIDEVNVWRGGVGAAFGGRVGGLVEINTDEKVAKTLSAGAGLSLLTADAFVKAPLAGGKSDLQLAFRGSPGFLSEGPAYEGYRAQVFQGDVFARILRAEENNLPQREDFNFREFNGRWRYNFSPEQTLTVSGFSQHDDFGYLIGRGNTNRFFAEGLIVKNDGISGNYRQPLGKGEVLVQLTLSAFSGKGGTSFQNGGDGVSSRRASEIEESSARVEYELPVVGQSTLQAGVQAQQFRHELDYLTEDLLTDSLGAFSFSGGMANAVAAYGNYHWQGKERLFVEAGLRLQYYEPTGEVYPEPRLSLGYRTGKDWLVKAAYGESHQFTQEIVNLNAQRVSSMVSLWTLADNGRLPVAAGREGSLGISGEAGDWFFDVEGYYKRINGITTINTLLLREGFTKGTSRALGVDVLVKKRWANWRSWAIYTLSNTKWRFPELGPDYFPADNDRRHQLQLIHTYTNNGWSASVGWRIHSGIRYTEFRKVLTEVWPGSDWLVNRLEVGPTNEARLPAFHRLDFSVFRELVPTGKRWYARAGLSVSNLYGRRNLLERQYLVSATGLPAPNRYDLEEVDRTGLGFTPDLSLRIGFR
ncbi:TonB-dependent receptor [Neolewinella aurantiaca]|uniref:TonB-dependent receptor n=1 Tax=Neolewinella aurantiaca TaxID=2602767 RepID=A0A5C7FX56_9BACT|nr:TonB-dependent receptor plug domain-containing protein [Neolewinella aurantiaca]TXF90134.1 TonB-dependent receptor [Neolewinella aurantiaca]